MSMSSGSWSIPEVVQSFGHKGIDCISYVLAIARILAAWKNFAHAHIVTPNWLIHPGLKTIPIPKCHISLKWNEIHRHLCVFSKCIDQERL